LKSFSPVNIFEDYWSILFIKKGKVKIKKLIINLFIPLAVSTVLIIVFDGINSGLVNTLGILVSVLAGLLFNFVSSLNSHINSDHLAQQEKEKLKRLKLIKETYTSTFVSILICVVLIFLAIIISLSSIDAEKNFWAFILLIVQFITSILAMLLVFHLIMFLILMLNRLKKLMDTDVKQEIDVHTSLRKEDIDHWD